MPRNSFPKGVSGNPNGRKKGTPNKVTGKCRELIQSFCEGYITKIKSDFEQLDPKDRVKTFTDLLPFFLPKCQAIDLTAKVDAEIDIKKNMYSKLAEQYAFSEQVPEEDMPEQECDENQRKSFDPSGMSDISFTMQNS